MVKPRLHMTRFGELILQKLQLCDIILKNEVFDRYSRAEKVLVIIERFPRGVGRNGQKVIDRTDRYSRSFVKTNHTK